MGQTRVNLRHLLEDLRDGYPYPIHEAVLTELVANALDSGASRVAIRIGFDPPRLDFVDNGTGMSSRELETYHDIASTSKQRGRGIGFAGVGAKLSLLISREVVTETQKGEFHGATRWWLAAPTHAPWQETPPPGLLFSSGTAVRLELAKLDSPLLDGREVGRLLERHFEPLFDPELARFLFLYYPGGVSFEVDGQKLELAPPADAEPAQSEVPGSRRRPLGMVRLWVCPTPLLEEQQGLAVSVLGKVVKRGWEWLGIMPEHRELVTGVVEVPGLVELLTTNKADFLRDAASLQRFYTIRKRVQETVAGLLQNLGELPGRRARQHDLRPVEREIDQVLSRILERFPELEPLLERRRGFETASAVVGEGELHGEVASALAAALEQASLPGLESAAGEEAEASPPASPASEPQAEGAELGGEVVPARRRRPGLRLAWVDEPERAAEISWLEGGTLAVNRAHPAFSRARGPAAERLYLVTAIALALARQLETEHDPLGFVSQLLARWGERLAPADDQHS